jgi:hypothetical protein
VRSIGWWRRLGVIGVSVAAVALPAQAVGATTRSGDLGNARFLLNDAPSFTFPGAGRLPPFVVNQLTAAKVEGGYQFQNVRIVDPPGDRPFTTRIAFYPPNGEPWGLQWAQGAEQAEVVEQTRPGTAGTGVEALPEYAPTKLTVPLVTMEREVELETTSRTLKKVGLELSADTAVQLAIQFELGGTTGYQGSPIVSLAALTGTGPQLAAPEYGITHVADGSSQPWAVVPARPVLKFDAGYRDADVEDFDLSLIYRKQAAAAKALESLNEVRVFHTAAAFTDSSDGTLESFARYDGVVCRGYVPDTRTTGSLTCDLVHGDSYQVEVTGQTTVEVVRKGKRLKFVIEGDVVFLDQPGGYVQVDVLFLLKALGGADGDAADGDSVGVRTPFVPCQ